MHPAFRSVFVPNFVAAIRADAGVEEQGERGSDREEGSATGGRHNRVESVQMRG